MDENLQKKIDNLIKNGGTQDFKVIEFGIDFNVVREYWQKINKIKEPLSSEDLAEHAEQILVFSEEEQKDLLAQLGKSGTVASYRSIEKYMDETPTEELKKWAVVALQHCRIHLENELMDEPIGFIATGLGGKGQKIRYYFVLFSKEPLREVMIDEVAANYREVAKRYDAEIESVEQIGNQISIGLLCPMKVQLSEIVEEGIEGYHFLEDHYIATNMQKPDETLIQKWLKDKEKSLKEEKMKERINEKDERNLLDLDENDISYN
jgi:hypothetical protein